MVNAKFVQDMSRMGRKEFMQALKARQKTSPEHQRLEDGVALPASEWVAERDLPFAVDDRVQVTSGPHKNKIGYIVAKHPFSNAFTVNGISDSKIIVPVENRASFGDPEQYTPITDRPKTFDFRKLRLVSKIRTEAGAEQDVAIHSVALGPERYNPVSNRHERVRFAAHDRSLEIPWPYVRAQRVDAEKAGPAGLTTAPEAADLRTHFVASAVDAPLPLAAIPQITNLHNRYKRGRYARRITAADVERFSAPKMPTTPATAKLLEQIAAMPKPEPVPFSDEMREFIGGEIKRGVAQRLRDERAALRTYE